MSGQHESMSRYVSEETVPDDCGDRVPAGPESPAAAAVSLSHAHSGRPSSASQDRTPRRLGECATFGDDGDAAVDRDGFSPAVFGSAETIDAGRDRDAVATRDAERSMVDGVRPERSARDGHCGANVADGKIAETALPSVPERDDESHVAVVEDDFGGDGWPLPGRVAASACQGAGPGSREAEPICGWQDLIASVWLIVNGEDGGDDATIDRDHGSPSAVVASAETIEHGDGRDVVAAERRVDGVRPERSARDDRWENVTAVAEDDCKRDEWQRGLSGQIAASASNGRTGTENPPLTTVCHGNGSESREAVSIRYQELIASVWATVNSDDEVDRAQPICWIISDQDDITSTAADTASTNRTVTTVTGFRYDDIPESIVENYVGVEVVTRDHGPCEDTVRRPVNSAVSTVKKKKKSLMKRIWSWLKKRF